MNQAEQNKAKFLEIAARHYDKLESLGQAPDFYSYEAEFDKIWTEFGRVVLEASIGEVPANQRKKTSSGRASGVLK